MATCRRVNIRMTTETTTTWERSVAVQQSEECPTPWLPDGLAPQPKTRKEQQTAVDYRLEMSEQEAAMLIGLLGAQNDVRLKAVASIYDALMAVVNGGKDFATRRPKGLVYGKDWEHKPVTVPGRPDGVEVLETESLNADVKSRHPKYGPDNPQYINGG